MAVLVTGNEIVLSGTVGDLYWDDSFCSAEVILALAQVGRGQDVTIRINSGGGIATEGAAIHAALTAHTGRKTIIIEGIAASAASVIAMAGDEIVMAMGAIMMIHDPSGFTFGTIAEHQLQIKALTALATAMAGIYADRSGRTVDEARADMQGELWMSPEEAVTAGYADRVQARGAISGADVQADRIEIDEGVEIVGAEPTAFDFRLYQHPPERLVALADRRAWTNRARPTAASPAVPPRLKEQPMANAPAGNEPVIPPNPSAALAEAVEGTKPTAPVSTVARADAAEIVTSASPAASPPWRRTSSPRAPRWPRLGIASTQPARSRTSSPSRVAPTQASPRR